MPPTISPTFIPPPTGRGDDARLWLETQGIISRVPSIRSSDDKVLAISPFSYYLSRRLGISSLLSGSTALTQGSWAHARLELVGKSTLEAHQEITTRLDARLSELSLLCKEGGIVGERRDRILNDEKQDAWTAVGWMEAALACPVQFPGSTTTYKNLEEFLTSFTLLGVELNMSYKHPLFPKVTMVITADRLVYDPKSNAVYIIDYKTCSEDTITRLQRCPLEFQTWHYLTTTKALTTSHVLHQQFPQLPTNARFGGMIHIAIQKPSIKFSMGDRDFSVEIRTLKSGPRKGQAIEERKYFGEPRLENFVKRSRDWYNAEGDYIADKPEREAYPPVNLSLTTPELLDEITPDYLTRMREINHYATCVANPENFTRSDRGMGTSRYIHPTAPLHVPGVPIAAWPAIMQENRLTITHRDSESPIEE